MAIHGVAKACTHGLTKPRQEDSLNSESYVDAWLMMGAPIDVRLSDRASVHYLQGERDCLAAADAQRHHAAAQAITHHRVQQTGDEDRAGGADRMAEIGRAHV